MNVTFIHPPSLKKTIELSSYLQWLHFQNTITRRLTTFLFWNVSCREYQHSRRWQDCQMSVRVPEKATKVYRTRTLTKAAPWRIVPYQNPKRNTNIPSSKPRKSLPNSEYVMKMNLPAYSNLRCTSQNSTIFCFYCASSNQKKIITSWRVTRFWWLFLVPNCPVAKWKVRISTPNLKGTAVNTNDSHESTKNAFIKQTCLTSFLCYVLHFPSI
jgi:hypothetical protein